MQQKIPHFSLPFIAVVSDSNIQLALITGLLCPASIKISQNPLLRLKRFMLTQFFTFFVFYCLCCLCVKMIFLKLFFCNADLYEKKNMHVYTC